MPINNSSAPMMQPMPAYVEREPERLETVQAGQNKNIFGGCGVSVAVLGLYALTQAVRFATGRIDGWRGELDLLGIWVLCAIGFGAVTFGIAAAVRSWEDEWEARTGRRRLQQDNEALVAIVDDLQGTIKTQEERIRQLHLQWSIIDNKPEYKNDAPKISPENERLVTDARHLVRLAGDGKKYARDPSKLNKRWEPTANFLVTILDCAEWIDRGSRRELRIDIGSQTELQAAMLKIDEWSKEAQAGLHENFVVAG